MSSSVTAQRPLHTHEILDRNAAWIFRDGRFRADDFDRACVENSAISFRRDGAALSFCLLVSSGGSHVATVEAETAAEITIKVTVYQVNEGFEKEWAGSQTLPPSPPNRYARYETTGLNGGITEDGKSVMVVYRPAGGETRAFIVTKEGFLSKRPPSDTARNYSLTSGSVSDDSEYIFYTRSGKKFGRGGEAKAVEAFSIRTLARLKAVTFSFGDGRHMRNTHLLRPLRLGGPVHLGVEASSFRDEDNAKSTMVIASSDGKLHWHAAGLPKFAKEACAAISPNGEHLFHVDSDDAMLYHWDLTKPTLEPIGSVRMPGVEYSPGRRWIIRGQETTIRDAVAHRIYQIRYSAASKVVTVVSASASAVIVNVFLSFNLQLIHHEKISHTTWAGLTPVRIGFNQSTGLTIVGMSPTLTVHDQWTAVPVGVLGTMLHLKDVYERIEKAEDYFDYTSSRIKRIAEADPESNVPLCRFAWRPDAIDRDEPATMAHLLGGRSTTTPEDSRRQKEVFEKIFGNSSVKIPSTPHIINLLLPHLLSFKYPWNEDQSVSVFAIIMRSQYHIIAIGPSASAPGRSPDVIRALFVNEGKPSRGEERIEFYKSGSNFILSVSRDQSEVGGYSGMRIPTKIQTIASPHFLEEDAWYDTAIIHESRHITMVNEMSYTPNMALQETANIIAYFKPRSFVVNDVMDYGHRANSRYAAPKFYLWKEYGLRAFRSSNTNDVFFGNPRYFNLLGPYFDSIYDDKTYDDSQPLFASAFALVCNTSHRSRSTKHIDAFFRRLHQEDQRLLANTQSVTYSLPLACRARPMACLSFLRHLVLYRLKLVDVGCIEAKYGASTSLQDGPRHTWRDEFGPLLRQVWYAITPYWFHSEQVPPEPNTSHVTLPLQGFCSFGRKLYRAPSASDKGFGEVFFEFVQGTHPSGEEPFLRWEQQLVNWVASTGKGPASPFTRLVEEILDMQDRQLQLSFLRVVWLEKLLAWKLKTFGLKVFLTRTVLPILILFAVHLAVAVLSTGGGEPSQKKRAATIVLASIEGLVSLFIFYTKARMFSRVPRLFLRSIPNYVDVIAAVLGTTAFGLVMAKGAPPRAFLAFSTLLIWLATIHMLRIYKPIGMLLLLLTETLQDVFSFLTLLSFIILGFAFVPYLLLRNVAETESATHFATFPLTITQMLNFVASDYSALDSVEAGSPAVRTLKSLYIIVITVLFLNTLIAILNLKIKRADKNAANLYHLQMASLQVEIELGLLSSSERERRDWFPEWFSYSMTETEKRVWNEFVEKNPLKWTEENNFPEDKDHAPEAFQPPAETPAQPQTTQTARTTSKAPAKSSDEPKAPTSQISQPSSSTTTQPAQSSEATKPTAQRAAPGPSTTSVPDKTTTTSTTSPPPPRATTPAIIHDKKPVDDLLSALGPIDVSQLLPADGGKTLQDHLAYDEWEDQLSEDDDDLYDDGGGFSTDPTSKCIVCSRRSKILCPDCGKVGYCSDGHMKAGERMHAPSCEGSGLGSQIPMDAGMGEDMVEMTDLRCVVCGERGKRCQGCQLVAYCGKEHQKEDWKRHKRECKGKGKAKEGTIG